jgi:hypothetical protein
MSRNELGKIPKVGVVPALLFLGLLVMGQDRPSRAARDDGAVYVGLIEDDRRELAMKGANDSGPTRNRVIMTAFSKDAEGWKNLDGLNQKIKWTVAFDGKKLGEVESQPSPKVEAVVNENPVETSSTYARAVHVILTPADKVPVIGKPGGRFNGAFETVVRRPLVVVSKPNFQDPDRWKATTLPTELVQPIRTAFKQTYQHVRQCDAQGEPLKHDWEILGSELIVVKAYGSSKGFFLVETQLAHRHCVFDVNGENLANLEGTQWFSVSDNRAVRHLGNDWNLVDAGDYDADEKSEVIFFFGDNQTGEEGFVLFYDDFHGQVTWSYR